MVKVGTLVLFLTLLKIKVRPSQCNQAREIKYIHGGKELLKLSLFTDNLIVYTENPKEI